MQLGGFEFESGVIANGREHFLEGFFPEYSTVSAFFALLRGVFQFEIKKIFCDKAKKETKRSKRPQSLLIVISENGENVV